MSARLRAAALPPAIPLPVLLLAVLMLLLAPPLVAPQEILAQAREMRSVARPSINMRAGPGTHHDAQWRLTRGYPLEIIGREGSWYQVRDFERDTGWIHRPLLSRAPHHIVKANVANIRAAPGTRSRILGKARYGEVLRTVEKRPQWVKVRDEGGLVGWISRRLLWGW